MTPTELIAILQRKQQDPNSSLTEVEQKAFQTVEDASRALGTKPTK